MVSQSVSQSVCLSWCRVRLVTYDQILVDYKLLAAIVFLVLWRPPCSRTDISVVKFFLLRACFHTMYNKRQYNIHNINIE
jgi:hypothetical protein